MRLWCQLPVKMDRSISAFDRIYTLLEEEYALVKRPDTETIIKDVSEGTLEVRHLLINGFLPFLRSEAIRAMIQAEKEGYDAVVTACYADVALREARQLLNIPVIGVAESSMHVAATMGRKFAIITITPQVVPLLEENLHGFGMSANAIDRNPVRSLTSSLEGFFACVAGDYTPAIEGFKEIAAGCIADGAEVLIPGCTAFAPMFTLNGIKEVDGVPILDPVLVSVKVAEMMVDLQKAGLPTVSRKGLYCEAPVEEIEWACASTVGIR